MYWPYIEGSSHRSATSLPAIANRSASANRPASIARAACARSRCHRATGQPSRSTKAAKPAISASANATSPTCRLASMRHRYAHSGASGRPATLPSWRSRSPSSSRSAPACGPPASCSRTCIASTNLDERLADWPESRIGFLRSSGPVDEVRQGGRVGRDKGAWVSWPLPRSPTWAGVGCGGRTWQLRGELQKREIYANAAEVAAQPGLLELVRSLPGPHQRVILTDRLRLGRPGKVVADIGDEADLDQMSVRVAGHIRGVRHALISIIASRNSVSITCCRVALDHDRPGVGPLLPTSPPPVRSTVIRPSRAGAAGPIASILDDDKRLSACCGRFL